MNRKNLFALLFSLTVSCGSSNFLYAQNLFIANQPDQVFSTLAVSIQTPHGYYRIPADFNSFAAWLREMPLLPPGSPVMDYRSRIWKSAEDSTVAAVVAMKIEGRKLDQCMDILIRMYIEYLLETGRHKLINIPLPDGTFVSWDQWAGGWRPVFEGANFRVFRSAKPDSSMSNLHKYLNTIFEFSGTQTFYHYYPDIRVKDVSMGDFITKKGKKGHAVMVVDLVENEEGERMALIGQGDTPACQFYLLKNSDGSPWFKIDTTKKEIPLPIKKKMTWDGLRRFGN